MTERTIKDEIAAKIAENKPPLDMVPPSLIIDIAWVLAHGAIKYGKNDWRRGFPYTERYASALRHLLAWRQGEENDPESNLPHLHHTICQLAMISEYTRTHPECDDRERKIG